MIEMKWMSFLVATMLFQIPSFGQTFINCNSFDSTITGYFIDSNSIWSIGKPNKFVFNDSYQSDFSIVTGLDSLYPNQDSSSFYVFLDFSNWGFIPNYLGLFAPLELEFKHRFITDSTKDFGSIHMSLDNGLSWYNIFSRKSGYLYSITHFNENTGVTITDSLRITGNSNGWIHTKIIKDFEDIGWNTTNLSDRLIVRFKFETDSVGIDEGWQIDDLCLKYDFQIGIDEIQEIQDLNIFPNPCDGSFILGESNFKNLSIYDISGHLVFETDQVYEPISTGLKKGVYIVSAFINEKRRIKKLIVK